MRPHRSSRRIRSIFTKAYRKSRYDKGDADYINCAMNEEEFDRFYDELIHAETAELHDIDKEIYFEGCMPVEEIARRGRRRCCLAR